jgi:mono/diheme cytochrome c family protein
MSIIQRSLALLLVCTAAWPQIAAADVANVANGKRAYMSSGCFTCHGRSGQGGAMNYPAPPLAKTEHSVEVFSIMVRAGIRDMPAFVEAVLSDKDLADIHAFLRSLPGRRDAKEIPLLNQ